MVSSDAQLIKKFKHNLSLTHPSHFQSVFSSAYTSGAPIGFGVMNTKGKMA